MNYLLLSCALLFFSVNAMNKKDQKKKRLKFSQESWIRYSPKNKFILAGHKNNNKITYVTKFLETHQWEVEALECDGSKEQEIQPQEYIVEGLIKKIKRFEQSKHKK